MPTATGTNTLRTACGVRVWPGSECPTWRRPSPCAARALLKISWSLASLPPATRERWPATALPNRFSPWNMPKSCPPLPPRWGWRYRYTSNLTPVWDGLASPPLKVRNRRPPAPVRFTACLDWSRPEFLPTLQWRMNLQRNPGSILWHSLNVLRRPAGSWNVRDSPVGCGIAVTAQPCWGIRRCTWIWFGRETSSTGCIPA